MAIGGNFRTETRGPARPTRIRFIGQCLLQGYPGVGRADVFPALAARRLETSLDETRVVVSAGDFYHPAQLLDEVDRSLARADVIVIDVAGLPVATGRAAVDMSRLPTWAVGTGERIRHLRQVRHDLLAAHPRGERWVALIEVGALALARNALSPLIRRYSRPTLEEYELIVREAVNRIQTAKVRLVLQGPAGFNPDEPGRSYAPDTPRIYDDVNAMTRRIAEAEHLPMLDRIAIGQDHRTLFLPGSRRYSRLGHRVMGEALAELLLDVGFI
jgi:hypothetical protein